MNSLRRIGSRFLTNPHQLCNRFGNSAGREHSLTRDWLAKLWHEERKTLARRKRKQENIRNVGTRDPGDVDASPFQLPFLQSVFSRAVPAVEEEERREKKTARQPPFGQNLGGPLSPTSPEEVNAMNEPTFQSFLRLGKLKREIFEGKLSRSIPPAWLVKLAPLLARSNLVITRDIEWANIMFAIEQESRYTIVDACYPEAPVGFIYEKSNLIFRQLLRTRRPFTAQIIDAVGNEIFTIRRPFWLINSSIYAEVDGKEIGVVHRRWHLWRRIYDLYLGNKQFAVVENPGFWNWTFTLKDESDNVLAQIARDWRGIGFELFTDAGQYVIRFGVADSSPKSGLASTIEELEVVRPLTLAERAVAVSLAVSLDSDYFSRRGGWGLPFFIATE